MPRRQLFTSKFIGKFQESPEFDCAVAADAGIRGEALFVSFEEGINDFFFEFFFEVENMERNTKRIRHIFCPGSRLRIAAFGWQDLGKRRGERIGPEGKSHSDKIVALLFEQVCDDRGVDTATHGNEDAHRT